jgi:hypothetical protein
MSMIDALCIDVYHTRFVFHQPWLKIQPGDHRQHRERDADRDERAAGTEPKRVGQKPRQRQLQCPEYEEVDERGRPRVAGAGEGLRQHHAVPIEQEAGRHDAQAVHV